MISITRTTNRNVTRCRDGHMGVAPSSSALYTDTLTRASRGDRKVQPLRSVSLRMVTQIPRDSQHAHHARVASALTPRWKSGEMRVLILVDEAYFAIPGGHRVQMDRTQQALRARGLDVTVADEKHAPLDGVDVVHALVAEPSALRQVRLARIPLVMSTVYCGREYVVGRASHRSAADRVGQSVRLGGSVLRRGSIATADQFLWRLTAKRLAFETCDLLLPNSQAEARAIADELGVTTPMHVVPNGADHRTFVPPDEASPRRGVLYVARIEPHKNQLGLIQALSGRGMELTLVGPPHPHHLDYLAVCRAAAGPEVTFLPGRSQAELVPLYQRAAVHAMPSWCETTGLSSLEAALCGARVVTTSAGYAREYFTNLAHYCRPGNRASIRQAVEEALATPPSLALRQQILERYTWDHVAAATEQAYRRLAGD